MLLETLLLGICQSIYLLFWTKLIISKRSNIFCFILWKRFILEPFYFFSKCSLVCFYLCLKFCRLLYDNQQTKLSSRPRVLTRFWICCLITVKVRRREFAMWLLNVLVKLLSLSPLNLSLHLRYFTHENIFSQLFD